MSDGNTTSRRRRNWWKRNRWNALFSVLGAIASGYIGYLIGFHIDVSKNMYDCIVKIGTSIDNFNTNMAKMDTAINVYHDEVHSVIKNFIINPDTGIKCKVGVNNTNDIYFVTVSKLHNPHMLNDGDKLLFISENKSTRSRYCVEAYVQL